MTVIVREPTVAAFDFDGTLTRGESFFRFLRHVTPLPRFLSRGVARRPQSISRSRAMDGKRMRWPRIAGE